VWDAALAAPGYDGPPVWLHGDLHPANILVNDCQVSFWPAYQAAGGQAGTVLENQRGPVG
jgi:hypothetical protein